MVSVNEALKIIEKVLDQGCLNKIQIIIFRQCFEGYSYSEIAKSSGYEVGYIRDIGYRLWKLLSQAFGKKVTKNNFHSLLQQQYAAIHTAVKISNVSAAELPHPLAVASEQITAIASTAIQHQYWGEAIDVSNFHGK